MDDVNVCVIREDGMGSRTITTLLFDIKFFSVILFVALYLLFCPDNDKIRFAVAFLIIYFLYSIFEVVILKKENERQFSSKENKKQA